MKSEIQQHADFNKVRYANCWEDADILVTALEPKGKHCLSIGSAGDNAFALLAAGAKSVVISEMNPAQVACIELRKAAYHHLSHPEFLTLLGETGSNNERLELYQQCAPSLSKTTRSYWDHYQDTVAEGFGRIGKFESYFGLFKNKILPLVHGRKRIDELLQNKPLEERSTFYQQQWNTWRWRILFKCFFSRFTMGKLGRDPAFFKYVEGSVAEKILSRTKHALVELEPGKNPYLNWILNGCYRSALPYALRLEHFDTIKKNLHRITIKKTPIEAVLQNNQQQFDAFNLSDIFEYMSEGNTTKLLQKIHSMSTSGARLAYWNMLAPRSRPDSMSKQLRPLDQLSQRLFYEDKAFFYSKFIIEEVIKANE